MIRSTQSHMSNTWRVPTRVPFLTLVWLSPACSRALARRLARSSPFSLCRLTRSLHLSFIASLVSSLLSLVSSLLSLHLSFTGRALPPLDSMG